MRKIFYTLGATASAVTPLVVTISCGSQEIIKAKVIDYKEWSTYPLSGHFSTDEKWWKKHQINGEDLLNLDSTDHKTFIGHIVPNGPYMGKFETATKIYWFSVHQKDPQSELQVLFKESEGACIVDKATNSKTLFTSLEDIEAKVIVTEKPVKIITQAAPKPFVHSVRTDRHFASYELDQASKMENFKLPGESVDYNVATEGLYILKDDYKDGTLWEGDKNGKALTDSILPMKVEGGDFPALFKQRVLEMGKEDSVYFLFNDNNDDGLSPDNFLNELVFVDTSAFTGEEEVQFTSTGSSSGILDKWYGSQSNHAAISFDQAMAKLQKSESADKFAQIAAYYGVETDAVEGHYPDDSARPNHANRTFAPFVSDRGYFRFYRVAKNAFKITFKNPSEMTLSESFFRIYNQKTKAVSSTGYFSLGASGEWSAYENSQTINYEFYGRKNEFVNQKP